MATRYAPHVFSSTDIEFIQNLPEVMEAKARVDLQESGAIYFSIPLTPSLRSSIFTSLGLDLTAFEFIPMRWIKGDTAPHVDRSVSAFKNTYLVYLNDCPGEFIIGDESLPISQNIGYIFQEGITHYTSNTGFIPRLLLGPMNELSEPVGASTNFYYPSEADALANTNLIAAYGNYTIPSAGSIGGYTHWRLASNSTGPSPQNAVYYIGNTLSPSGLYYLYPTSPCFLEGSKVLCLIDGVEKYIAVEELRKDTLVKTSRDGFKKVVGIGKGVISNPGGSDRIENRLYCCSRAAYPELSEDLIITGAHSILVDSITESQRIQTIRALGKIFVTDRKYRLTAQIDDRTIPWGDKKLYSIWHFSLENEDERKNYGVYANGGLLVETCSIMFLKIRSNMSMV